MTDDPTRMDDHAVSRRLADSAGEVLLRLRADRADLTGSDLKDAGDRASQEHLAAALAAYRPQDAVLSEEAKDVGDRASAGRVWIIDPLDGTREYGEPGREDWAVHVALWAGRRRSPPGPSRCPPAGPPLATDAPPALPDRPGRCRRPGAAAP